MNTLTTLADDKIRLLQKQIASSKSQVEALQQQLDDITEKGRLVLSGMAKHQPKEYMRHVTGDILIKYT